MCGAWRVSSRAELSVLSGDQWCRTPLSFCSHLFFLDYPFFSFAARGSTAGGPHFDGTKNCAMMVNAAAHGGGCWKSPFNWSMRTAKEACC